MFNASMLGTFGYDLVDVRWDYDALHFVQFEVFSGFSQTTTVPAFVLKRSAG